MFGCDFSVIKSLCSDYVILTVKSKSEKIELFLKIVSTAKSASIQDRLLNAFAIVTMMGLTWIFGYFLLAPVNVVYQEAMQWLFTLFNIFQVIIKGFYQNLYKTYVCKCLEHNF